MIDFANWEFGEIEFNQKCHSQRKPAFSIWENKGADQLGGNRAADQHLCFSYIEQSLYFLNPKASNHLLWLYNPSFMSDLVGNPEDRLSGDTA